MNKVDTYVRGCMRQYPEIFPNRSRVLEHTFCVIGNGMVWDEHGCLVDVFGETPAPGGKVIPENSHLLVVPLTNVYPMSSEYSNLCTAPENIDTEWADALLEIADGVMEYEDGGSENYRLAEAASEKQMQRKNK